MWLCLLQIFTVTDILLKMFDLSELYKYYMNCNCTSYDVSMQKDCDSGFCDRL